MSLQISGKITKVLQLESGQTKTGTEWQKQSFILDSGSQYNNTYCFEVFGVEKVENFNKYNKVGDNVTVEFNVNCNEYNGKYYTTLSAWKISKAETQSEYNIENPTYGPSHQEFEGPLSLGAGEENSDLPF